MTLCLLAQEVELTDIIINSNVSFSVVLIWYVLHHVNINVKISNVCCGVISVKGLFFMLGVFLYIFFIGFGLSIVKHCDVHSDGL